MIQNTHTIVVKVTKILVQVSQKKIIYVTKLDTMVDDGIIKDTYKETTNNT